MTDQKVFLQNIFSPLKIGFTIYPFFCAAEWFRHFPLFDPCSSQGRKIQNYNSGSELETDKSGRLGIFNSFSKRGSHSFCCNVPREANTCTEQHICGGGKLAGKEKACCRIRCRRCWMRGRSVCVQVAAPAPRGLGSMNGV